MPSFSSFRLVFLAAVGTLLAACQSLPAPKGFSPAQIAVLQSEGFVPAQEDPAWILTLSDRLLFATDESALVPEQVERLTSMSRNLLSVGINSAEIRGHTDSTGAADYNMKLSQARAAAVAAPMTEQGMQLRPDQITGYGETIPLSSNATPEGRQDNRRVEIIVSPQ